MVVEGREYPVPPRYFSWMEEELADVKLDRKLKVKERENRLGMPEIARERRAKEVYQQQRLQERKAKEKVGTPWKQKPKM